jgi:iron(III) transport system substrate-binding protein
LRVSLRARKNLGRLRCITRRHFIARRLALWFPQPAGVRSVHRAGRSGRLSGRLQGSRREGGEGGRRLDLHIDGRCAGAAADRSLQGRVPGIRVDYNDLGTNGAYNRVISEAAAKQVGSDIVWTSAMDLQMVLVSKGQAETYKSPETAQLPAWANFQRQLYATSVEPIAIMYNKSMLGALKPPQTRAELISLPANQQGCAEGQGRLVRSGEERHRLPVLQQRRPHDHRHLGAGQGFRRNDPKVYGSSGAMREKISSGEHWIAFNVIGSYAIEWAKKNSNLGVVLTPDHAAAFSRVANISKGAPHPAAARVFLDFLSVPARADGDGRQRRAVCPHRCQRRPQHRQAQRDGRRQAEADPRLGGAARSIRSENPRRVLPEMEAGAARLTRPSESIAMSLANDAPRFRAGVILALFVMVAAPALLVIYQSVLDAPFFDDEVRFSLEAFRFVLTDPEFYRAFWTTTLYAFGMVLVAVPLGGCSPS